jgi:uncharacterized phage-associated protein
MPTTTSQAKYPASLIARYFLWKASSEGKQISNKKLQKLLYYAQAWYLVFHNKPLFKDEIEAWIHGPAVRKVYGTYKKYGFDPIQVVVAEETISKVAAGDDRNLLDEVWRVYGKFDAAYLERLSHNERPWLKAREGLEASTISRNTISIKDMKEYFASLLTDDGKRA